MSESFVNFEFFNADEWKANAAKRHWTEEKIDKLNQLTNFKNFLTSKWKWRYWLHWGEVMPLFSQEINGYEFLQNSYTSDFTGGGSENLGFKHKRQN